MIKSAGIRHNRTGRIIMVKNVLYKLKGLIAVYIIMGLVSQLMM